MPFGGEADLGADFTLDPSFQVGLQAQGIMRAPETVSIYNDAEKTDWNVNVVGGALVLKYLISAGSNFNIIVHGEGGYYALVGSTAAFSGAISGTMNLDAQNVGGMGALEAEFLLDGNNSAALDIGLGYRYLQMTPVALSGTFNGATPSGNLSKAAGGDAILDLSGLRMNATLRFY